jgi:pSer/pThr/pTyr-binding forkhead associated (FHA) protein
LEIDVNGQAIVGRQDLQSGFRPKVNLAKFDAISHGVSRKHAEILFQNGQWLIQDLGSTNGTKVGQRRLSPYQPCPLRHRDQIQVGSLVLYIEFLQ